MSNITQNWIVLPTSTNFQGYTDFNYVEDGTDREIRAAIGSLLGGSGAAVVLAVGVGSSLSNGPVGFSLALGGTLAAECGMLYAGVEANEFKLNKYKYMLGVASLCAAAGSTIGAIRGTPLLPAAIAGAAAPFAIGASAMVGAAVGGFISYIKG